MSWRNAQSAFGRSIEPLERRVLLAAAAVPLGPEFQVNTFTIGDQTLPSVAADANGDFVVAWEGATQDGLSTDIYAQRFDASGVAKGAEFLVNTFTTGTQSNPAVAMDDDGDFVIAWTSAEQDDPLCGVFAQRYDATGAPHGGEFHVNTYTTHEQARPRVAMDAQGNFIIVWESFGQDGAGNGLFAQRYDAAGIPQDSEFRVNTFTSSHQFYPAAAMDDDGDFVIAWTSNYQDGHAYGIYAQRYDAAGAPQGGEFRVNTYTISDQAYPTAAMDHDGDFVVAWSSYVQDNSHWGTYAQRYDATGVPQGGEFRVNTYTTGAQFLPSAAMDADGDFVITWTGRGPSDNTDVHAQQFDAAGTALGKEFRVNTQVVNFQRLSAVAMDDDGDFVVAWSSQYQDGDGYGVFAQRYAVAPSVTASSFHFATAPHKLSFTFDRDVSASLGIEDFVVQNFTSGQTIPSHLFSLQYDTATNIATLTYTATGGVLPGGRYRATLHAAGVMTPQGAPLSIDHQLNFLFQLGDANNDGQVNLADFNSLAANFGQSPRDFTQGDFNYDGQVNLADFNILAANFGVTLGAGSKS